MMKYVIECRNIVKTYQSGEVVTQALRDVSFDVPEGEFVAIMGPSGSGKSTLMHIVGTLDTLTSGTYKLDGENISSFSEEQLAEIRKKKIGFVFQQFNLLPRATALHNVGLPLVYTSMLHKERLERAKDALRGVGLPEQSWNHLSNQLSGGEMQRVAIARALVNNPAIILADEPTGNLDTRTGEIVLATFQKLHRERHTIILITHELDVAAHAERIIHIRDGEIVKDEKNASPRTIHT